MSVWPDLTPAAPSLSSSEGELVSVRVSVEPRLLEDLLEALSEVPFSINPQIYHQAGIAYIYPDGGQELAPATMVEFPAYASRLPEVQGVMRRHGFPPDLLHVRSMLEDIHSNEAVEPAPAGAPYRQVVFYKRFSRT